MRSHLTYVFGAVIALLVLGDADQREASRSSKGEMSCTISLSSGWSWEGTRVTIETKADDETIIYEATALPNGEFELKESTFNGAIFVARTVSMDKAVVKYERINDSTLVIRSAGVPIGPMTVRVDPPGIATRLYVESGLLNQASIVVARKVHVKMHIIEARPDDAVDVRGISWLPVGQDTDSGMPFGVFNTELFDDDNHSRVASFDAPAGYAVVRLKADESICPSQEYFVFGDSDREIEYLCTRHPIVRIRVGGGRSRSIASIQEISKKLHLMTQSGIEFLHAVRVDLHRDIVAHVVSTGSYEIDLSELPKMRVIGPNTLMIPSTSPSEILIHLDDDE